MTLPLSTVNQVRSISPVTIVKRCKKSAILRIEVRMDNRNSDILTLALSRQLAIADGRNTQAAMIATARTIRARTKDSDTYESLGLFITATPTERHTILNMTEGMALR